uniref:Uncharacterized protein n=1 Tax=Plectus sambesii TaxID=2011161 RepID=A0A914UVJ2_9BILA
MPASSSTSSPVKRTAVLLAVGGVSVAVIAWLFNRRRKSQKSLSRADSGIEITPVEEDMASSSNNDAQSPSQTRGGRRNYRQEAKDTNSPQKSPESVRNAKQPSTPLPFEQQPLSRPWSEEVERLEKLQLDDRNKDLPTSGSPDVQHMLQHDSKSQGYQTIESPSIASLHSEVRFLCLCLSVRLSGCYQEGVVARRRD